LNQATAEISNWATKGENISQRTTLRSILWNIGFAINVGIFFLPAIRGYLPT